MRARRGSRGGGTTRRGGVGGGRRDGPDAPTGRSGVSVPRGSAGEGDGDAGRGGRVRRRGVRAARKAAARFAQALLRRTDDAREGGARAVSSVERSGEVEVCGVGVSDGRMRGRWREAEGGGGSSSPRGADSASGGVSGVAFLNRLDGSSQPSARSLGALDTAPERRYERDDERARSRAGHLRGGASRVRARASRRGARLGDPRLGSLAVAH